MRESSFAWAWRGRFYVAAIINEVVLKARLSLSLNLKEGRSHDDYVYEVCICTPLPVTLGIYIKYAIHIQDLLRKLAQCTNENAISFESYGVVETHHHCTNHFLHLFQVKDSPRSLRIRSPIE